MKARDTSFDNIREAQDHRLEDDTRRQAVRARLVVELDQKSKVVALHEGIFRWRPSGRRFRLFSQRSANHDRVDQSPANRGPAMYSWIRRAWQPRESDSQDANRRQHEGASFFQNRTMMALSCGAVACAAGLLAFYVASKRAEPLRFVVGESSEPAGRYIEAPGNRSLPLHFSDGSRVTLEGGATARIDRLRKHGATLRIEDGTAHVEVAHHEETAWQVQGGPYTVHVVGTRFFATWDRNKREFSVTMEEGKVRIDGPGFAPRTLSGGGSFVHRSEGPGDTAKRSADHGELAADRGTEASVPRHQGAPGAGHVQTHDKARQVAGKTAVIRDQGRLTAGKGIAPRSANANRNGVSKQDGAELNGAQFLATLRSASLEELRALGTQYRRAHRAQRALSTYQTIRERFPDSTAARDAAFLIARHHQLAERHGEAEQWLRRYLNEAPQGRWQAEAEGRLMEALHRQGQGNAARAAAKSYLAHHPEGGFHKLATELLRVPTQ